MQLVELPEEEKKSDPIPESTIKPTQAPVDPVNVGELLNSAPEKKRKMGEKEFIELKANTEFIRKHPDSESLIQAILGKYELDLEMRAKIGELRADEKNKEDCDLPF